MEKIVLFLLTSILLFADVTLITQCNECHNHRAPPYKKVYRQYLLVHSSKKRVEKAMIDFLNAPSREKSLMPKGMQRRFDPNKHPVFKDKSAKEAIEYIIERENLIKRFL